MLDWFGGALVGWGSVGTAFGGDCLLFLAGSVWIAGEHGHLSRRRLTVQTEKLTTAGGRGCHTGRMSHDSAVHLRLAIPEDHALIVEMARHASVIEDWPLPDVESDDVQTLLPAAGEVSIVAVDAVGRRVGAVWTFHDEPPLRFDSAGVPLPEHCVAVVPDICVAGEWAVHYWMPSSRNAREPRPHCV